MEEFSDIGMEDLFFDSYDWHHCFNDLNKGRKLSGVEVQLKKKDGSSFCASLNAKVTDNPDSEGHFWIDCSVEIINRRKLSENTNTAQMEALLQTSLSLTASFDLEQVLDTIAECALDLVPGMRNCHIFLYKPGNGDELIFGTALWGDGKRRQPFADPQPNGLTMRVAKSGEPILVTDLRSHYLYAKAPEAWTGSIIGLPLMIGDRVVGVMNVSHTQPGAFADSDIRILRLLGDQAAIAIENARLVDLLEVEQKRLAELVEHLPVGVILFDENYNPVVVNSLGKEILNLFEKDDDCDEFTKLGDYSIQELIEKSDQVQLSEISIGGIQPLVVEIEIRALDGKRPHWIMMLREVTEDRETQVRSQMQDRLATVGQLAAGIAHDFNNIMATILVYSDLLRKDLAMIPSGLDRLAIIQQQVQRASSLIRQILDFSRRSVMEQTNMDLLPFIKEFERLLERVLPETIRVELNYHPDKYCVHADPTHLQQVFMNLAVNARDAMPEGGILSFDIKRYQLGADDIPPSPYIPQGEWISVSVGDTGSGIPAEAIPHIFEPFFTTKPLGKGTGLGLAQAYGIVKQHGGYIDVQSRIGEGTRFSVFLPALPNQELDKNDRHLATPKAGRGKTILVVEDDPSTLNAIQDLLEAQQYQVFVAENGKEALEVYSQYHEKIDMLISDLIMPEMGGLALYNELQNLRCQVKILFVTGHPMIEESQTELSSEWISWLQKPFSVTDFFCAIEELLVDKHDLPQI